MFSIEHKALYAKGFSDKGQVFRLICVVSGRPDE